MGYVANVLVHKFNQKNMKGYTKELKNYSMQTLWENIHGGLFSQETYSESHKLRKVNKYISNVDYL